MHRTLFSSVLVALLAGASFGQIDTIARPASSVVDTVPKAAPLEAEQGTYARKSVSHLGIVLARGGGRLVSRARFGELQREFEQSFRLPRFDENPLALELVKAFGEATAGMVVTNRELSDTIETVLASAILDSVARRSVERAAALRTEFQRNSMVSDKTKTVDITGDQVLAVMNAAWLPVPVVEDVTVMHGPETVSVQLSMSLLWVHLRRDAQGKAHAQVRHELTASGFMLSRRSRGSFSGNAERFAFESAARSCVQSLLRQTKEIPEFSLSGQVQSAGRLRVGLDLGADAGVHPNERYFLVENQEDTAGRVSSKDVGWLRVNHRGDSLQQGSTGAWIVSGRPYVGMVLREIPLSSWSLEAGYRSEPASLALEMPDAGAWKGTLQGFRLGAIYTPDLWYGFGASLGLDYLWGRLTNPADSGTFDPRTFDLHFGVRQSLPLWRRLHGFVEPEVSLRRLTLVSSSSRSGANAEAEVVSWGVQGGFELALFPSLDLRAAIGLTSLEARFGSVDSSATLKNHGPTLGIQLHWTPPALSINPLDVVLGLVGI
jgi:hypothetical protein